jgi:homoserine dehydrogenase
VKKGIIFGYGNIGKTLCEKLLAEGVTIEYIVRSSGIYDDALDKVGERDDWEKFADQVDIAFLCIPTNSSGTQAYKYALHFLEKGKPVITCEKGSVGNYYNELVKFGKLFKYTASVGGGTQMLLKLQEFGTANIKEIKAVVNGTLNYIGSALRTGGDPQIIVNEVLEKGYAEPGADTLDEIIESELRDVVLKTVIIANAAEYYDALVKKEHVAVIKPNENTLSTMRCVVTISENRISAGYTEDTNAAWLPDGVLNALYINNELVAIGPGAGAEATVSSMLNDLRNL